MYPIYKFELDGNRAYPIYKDDLSKEFEKEQGQQFFREKLSGKLLFERNDYTYIAGQTFDTKFEVEIFISYTGGASWASYWQGEFWKTDCEFDEDAQTVSVRPAVADRYTAVMSGLEKEYNIIDLAPDIVPVKADKRPMIQVYVPGDTVIGCYLAGMWWEQECEAESSEATLRNTFYFYKNGSCVSMEVTGTMNPNVRGVYVGQALNDDTYGYVLKGGNGYSLRYTIDFVSRYVYQRWEIVRDSDDTVLFQAGATGQDYPAYPNVPSQLTLSAVGSASGSAVCTFTETPVYARMVLDTEIQGVTTYDLPADDIVPNNRNYHKVVPYNDPPAIVISTRMSASATEWGLYQPGQYYLPPDDTADVWKPLARSMWGSWSLWFDGERYDTNLEQSARAAFTIRHAYPVSSVISVLLGEIAPGVTHAATTDYSQFLYGENLIGITQTLLITPKSNIISSGYDQPAQKAMLTLKSVLDMLRDCFRCYWFIDEQNRFRVEHIEYFRNGGSYSTSPGVWADLTVQEVTRSGKKWAFARNQYEYDKPEMAARYEFRWMDNETRLFDGYPIDILSRYVNAENIEQINISQFSADIDYILLNPSDISADGFVLLGAVLNNGQYELPYATYIVGSGSNLLQNAYVAFCKLQDYYAYDMPASSYAIYGVTKTAIGVKRLKRQQIRFPALSDPNMLQTIKTGLGYGVFEKLSLNLSSRNANATLCYDTE